MLADLLLMSEIKGYVHRPLYYFEADDKEHRTALDHLLLVQGWRRYAWKYESGVEPFELKYMPEQGIEVHGQVVSFVRGKPKPNIQVSSFLAKRGDEETSPGALSLNLFETDSVGRFAFITNIIGKWNLTYFGVGNESWGCGGSMRPEYYADLYRRYSTYCRNYDGNRLFKIASGASDYDYKWTDVLMNRVGHRMDGLSLHYYTVTGWSGSKGSATQFNKDDYYWTMGKCLEVEDVLKKHCTIMDKYDKDKKIALLLDEWGTWWDEEPGTIKGHLYQQNTLRDAFVASLSLDVFHKYTDRLKMANIAQIVNVLQSMILTKDKEMVLTPTYYVFKMYKVHQDATYLPIDLTCEKMSVRDNRTVPMVSATASKNKDGVIHISLSNVDADEAQEITINLGDTKAKKAIGEILTASKLTDYNSFEKPNIVKPAPFKEVKINKGTMKVKLPAKSIVTLELQ